MTSKQKEPSKEIGNDGTKEQKKKEEWKPLESAPPALHAQALVLTILAISIKFFPSTEALDQADAASVETFTKVLFPNYLSLFAVGIIRLLFGLVCFADITDCVLNASWVHETNYDPDTKLKNIVIAFQGYFQQEKDQRSWIKAFLTLSPFTMISFFVLGASFTLCGITTLLLATDSVPPQWLLRVSLLTFECAAPTTLLIAAIVKYVLWPEAMAAENPNNLNVLKLSRTLFEHNGNVIMCLVEIAFLGGLPIRFQHMSVAPIWGIFYIFFSWFMIDKWSKKEDGPQFIYPFFDTTTFNRWGCTIALAVLTLVLTIVYALFAGVNHLLSSQLVQQHEDLSRAGISLLLCLGVVLLVCRFRD